MHFAEGRCLKRHQIAEIKYLMDKFVHDFPEIYTARHHTQVVHSLVHVADSVTNYGPLQNYSTFSFENILGTVCFFSMRFAFIRLVGTITSSVHGTRMHAQEIKHNITILQAATADIERDDFNNSLKLFYTEMRSIHRQNGLSEVPDSPSTSTPSYAFYRLVNNEHLRSLTDGYFTESQLFYKALFVGKVRFTVSNGEVLDDGCVAFESQDGTLQAGFIRIIERRLGIGMNPMIHVEQFDIQKNHCLDLPSIDQSSPITIHCADFIYARLSGKKQSFPANKLIEKLAQIQTNERDYIIMRYPNLTESS